MTLTVKQERYQRYNQGLDVTFDTNEEALAFHDELLAKGYKPHVNREMKGWCGTVYKPYVEACQGAHCHCRY